MASYEKQLRNGMLNHLFTYTRPDDFILVSSEDYRFNVMSNVPVHALRAWRSGEYYQLKTEISDQLEADYDSIMQCSDTIRLNHFCDKYDIHIALIHGPQEFLEFPAFQVVDDHWENLYGGTYFRIYRRD